MMVSPGLKHRRICRLVGLRAGMRLHVGILRAEQLFRAIARQVLHHVGEFAAAVIALARIAFRVFVGEDAAGGFEHRLRREVLAGDQLDLRVLPLHFMLDRLDKLRGRRSAKGRCICSAIMSC